MVVNIMWERRKMHYIIYMIRAVEMIEEGARSQKSPSLLRGVVIMKGKRICNIR